MSRRKIIASFVAAVLLANTASAVDFKDYVMSNSTGAGSWQDPMSHKKYYTGGSVTFKFKDPKYYPLWADARPPSINVGCGGISLDAGFLQLLGLDDLGQQLSDASGQKAYGVMLSLISSTPVLARVFETIRKWASAIQKLAQNACEMGQAWGRSNIGYDVTKKVDGYAANDGMYYKTAMDGSDAYAKELSDFVDKSVGDGNTITNLVTGMIGTKETSKSTDTLVNKASEGGFSKMFLQYVTDPVSKNKIGVNSTKKIFETGICAKNDAVLVPIAPSDKLTSDRLLYLAGLRYFGAVLVSRKGVEEMIYTLQDNGEFDTERLKALLRSNYEGEKPLIPKTVYLQPKVTSSQDMVNELLFGVDAAGVSMQVPDYLYIDTEIDGTPAATATTTGIPAITPEQKKKVRLMFLMSSDNYGTMDFNFEGVYQEMFKAVNASVVGAGGSHTDMMGNPIDANLADIDELLAPKAFSGLGYYSKVIARMERISGAETVETAALKTEVAQLGAYVVTERLIRGLGNGLITQLQSSADDNGEDAEKTRERVKSIIERTDKAIEELKKYFDFNAIESSLYDQISQIEESLNEDRTKQIR